MSQWREIGTVDDEIGAKLLRVHRADRRVHAAQDNFGFR
jgi:hypothetical protein